MTHLVDVVIILIRFLFFLPVNPVPFASTIPSTSPEKPKKSDHICPICKSSYPNIGNFKLHMKSHDNDHLKDQRNQLLSEIVATCYSKFKREKHLTNAKRLVTKISAYYIFFRTLCVKKFIFYFFNCVIYWKLNLEVLRILN